LHAIGPGVQGPVREQEKAAKSRRKEYDPDDQTDLGRTFERAFECAKRRHCHARVIGLEVVPYERQLEMSDAQFSRIMKVRADSGEVGSIPEIHG
jgi:hypothetical protein